MPSNLRRRRPGHPQGQQREQQQPVRHFRDAQSQTDNQSNKRQQQQQQQQQRLLRRPLTRAATAKNNNGNNNNRDSLKNVQHHKCDSNQGDVVMTHETFSKEKELDPIEAEKLKTEHVQKNVLELLENDLCCAICREIYINPVILNCSHSFCKFCLNAWLAKHDKCPTCRIDAIFHSENLALRDIVNKMMIKMPAQYQEARNEALKARESQEEIQNKTLPALRPRARNQSNEGWTANGVRESETRPIQRWTGLNGATIWRTPLNIRSRRGETDDEIDYDVDDYADSDDTFGSVGLRLRRELVAEDALSDDDDDDYDIADSDDEEEEEEEEEDVLEDDPDEDVDAINSDTESEEEEEEDSDTDVVEMDDEEVNEMREILDSDSEEEDDDDDGIDNFDFFYDNYVHNLRGDEALCDDLYSQWTIGRQYFNTSSPGSSSSSSSEEERTERLNIESSTSDSDTSDSPISSSSTDDEDAYDYVPTRRRIRGTR